MSRPSILLPCLLIVACVLYGHARANPVAFTKGDASFVGVIHRQSAFLRDGSVIDATTTFCSPIYLDYVKGIELDVSTVPLAQLRAVRIELEKVLATHPEVFLCVTDSDFDFKTTWLGIPYNRNPFRLEAADWMTNCFGPAGASCISIRDAARVPPLAVQRINDDRYYLNGKCRFCILKVEDIILQRSRIVIDEDGSTKRFPFHYAPEKRICFEEGDAFFIANAEPFYQMKGTDVELQYLVSRRRSYRFVGQVGENELVLSKDELNISSRELELRPKGVRLRIQNVPSQVATILKPIQGEHTWCVFVTAAYYDPDRHKLGLRYNKNPIGELIRPLRIEFVECNVCYETYPSRPIGIHEEPSWPKPLEVEWDNEIATAEYQKLQLIFVKTLKDMPFYQDQICRDQFRVQGNRIAHWSNGVLLYQEMMKAD